jgi:hypothetical protein
VQLEVQVTAVHRLHTLFFTESDAMMDPGTYAVTSAGEQDGIRLDMFMCRAGGMCSW